MAILDENLLARRLEQLESARSWSDGVVPQLGAALRTADDDDLFRINPPVYINMNGLNDVEGVDLFLHAAHQRLLEMEWHIICPYCTHAMESMGQLSQLPDHFACESCGGRHETALSDFIQVTFTPTPQIRHLPVRDAVRSPQGVVHLGGDWIRSGRFLSGTEVMTTQTFRDLFPTQTFRDDRSVLVNDITFLFTDLKGSTTLYDELGDARAYVLVRQYFDTLTQVVVRHRGAIVKTIGDAIMATFRQPADALHAAQDMLRDIDAINTTLPRHLSLKIGIHRGHSIAVTLNERLDYFGQTVNIASRVQHLAEGGDIYLSDDAYNAPGISEVVASCDLKSSVVELRGISGQRRVHRLLLR
jgi:class 3 adenylate cyclase